VPRQPLFFPAPVLAARVLPALLFDELMPVIFSWV
jgi:hypothetical protein